MIAELTRYLTKLEAEGVAAPGRCALLAANDGIVTTGAADLCRFGAAILGQLPAAALVVIEPSFPFDRFLLERLPATADRIVPRDTETRTFLHDIPVIQGTAADFTERAVQLLGCRRGVLIEGVGIVAAGAYTIEQAYINAASLFHALYVKYLLDLLLNGPHSAAEIVLLTSFRAATLREPSAAGLSFCPGPLRDPAVIVAEMERVGRYTVERRLVDSFFGNISCRRDNRIYISQTAASLDALAGCIDPIPFDRSTTLGLTASSELPAHRRIYEVTDALTILHGHPRFAVALSLLCPERARCGISDCWRDCPRVRDLGGVPVVAGEVGAGGLAKRVPPVIGASGRAIVYGHGVFTMGRRDFAEPFAALVDVERWCRAEYFRRLDCGRPYG